MSLSKFYKRLKSHDPQVAFFELVDNDAPTEALPSTLVIDVTVEPVAETPLTRGSKLAEDYYTKLVRSSTQTKVRFYFLDISPDPFLSFFIKIINFWLT